ncbi:hypothetical protein S40288_11096 [Stachybotrys chartarum IBT 40288]|nr:hypothetical protein S40288_11096 [Stachybotrys chartarum IBT 40288]
MLWSYYGHTATTFTLAVMAMTAAPAQTASRAADALVTAQPVSAAKNMTTVPEIDMEISKDNGDADSLAAGLGEIIDTAYIDWIEAFVKDKDTKSFDQTLEIFKDKVRGRATCKQQDAAGLKDLLSTRWCFVQVAVIDGDVVGHPFQRHVTTIATLGKPSYSQKRSIMISYR